MSHHSATRKEVSYFVQWVLTHNEECGCLAVDVLEDLKDRNIGRRQQFLITFMSDIFFKHLSKSLWLQHPHKNQVRDGSQSRIDLEGVFGSDD